MQQFFYIILFWTGSPCCTTLLPLPSSLNRILLSTTEWLYVSINWGWCSYYEFQNAIPLWCTTPCRSTPAQHEDDAIWIHNILALRNVCMVCMNQVRSSWVWGTTHVMVLISCQVILSWGKVHTSYRCMYMTHVHKVQYYSITLMNVHRMSQSEKWMDGCDINCMY